MTYLMVSILIGWFFLCLLDLFDEGRQPWWQSLLFVLLWPLLILGVLTLMGHMFWTQREGTP